MDFKYYMNVITNLSIIITFLFCLILIIDELYNIGIFSFKYTYQYNYGSFMSDFNNIESIECETHRYNLYNNTRFIYKDIFSKSYFNYLIIMVITLITILFSIAYGINFFFTFIINQPEVCSFYKSTSFVKTILKCLCDSCHEFLPDCTGNYLISFIIIIIIPISYFLKSTLNIDITPTSTTTLFSLVYMILFLVLIFSYSLILFNINKTDNNTYERITEVISYLFFTVIFITSGFIYKYVYKKYTDITLNKTTNHETYYDIYKQSPPPKPSQINEPIFKGEPLLPTFKYDSKSTDLNYKQKKEIMDDYYVSLKNYENDMRYYTQKYNNYINSNAKLGDTTNIINIIINIIGLNDKMTLYIIVILIIAYVAYYFYNNDIFFTCFIYILCIFTILKVLNGILYYNTILNKYIIYEPLAYYKNDITNANTKLNLLLDPSNGSEFYNILTNKQFQQTLSTNDINITMQSIIIDVKSLTIFDNFTYSNLDNINTKCKEIIIPSTDNIISPDIYDIYYGGSKDTMTIENIKLQVFDKISSFKIFNNINIFNYHYKPITFIDIYYDNEKIQLNNLIYYNRYIYYNAYLLETLLGKLRGLYPNSSKDINKYEKVFKKIQENYFNFQLNYTNDSNLKTEIDTDIKSINYIEQNSIDSKDHKKLSSDFFIKHLNSFITENIITINNYVLRDDLYSKIKIVNSPKVGYYNFFNKLNIKTNILTFKYSKDRITSDSIYFTTDIVDDINKINSDYIDIKLISKNKLFYTDSGSGSTYVKVPTKIIDNNYNEYYVISNSYSRSINDDKTYEGGDIRRDEPRTCNITLIKFKDSPKFEMITIRPINHDAKSDLTVYSYIFKKSKDTTIFIESENVANNYEKKDTFKAPYILKEFKVEQYVSTNIVDDFKSLIMRSLLNNLTHITSKYEYIPLKQKLFIKGYPIESAYNNANIIKNIIRSDYSNKFYTIETSIDYVHHREKNFLVNAAGTGSSYEAYVVLLYNIYTYDKDRIIDIIEYFIYKYKNYIREEYRSKYNEDQYLNINILSIKTQIDKTGIKNDFMKLYESNIYIVNLILKIYDNLIKYIKKEIETNIDGNLCHSTSSSKTEIEKKLFDHLNKYFTITNTNDNISNFGVQNSPEFTTTMINKVTEIGETIRNVYNICVFLLNSMDAKNDIQEEKKDLIISNFKFYNIDDTIKLDSSNIENVRRILRINDDYYSKYNNMDKKQKLNMKINADNVAYSFPVLLVIFIAILGETAFIKS